MKKSSFMREKTAISKVNHRLAELLGVLKRPILHQLFDLDSKQSLAMCSPRKI